MSTYELVHKQQEASIHWLDIIVMIGVTISLSAGAIVAGSYILLVYGRI